MEEELDGPTLAIATNLYFLICLTLLVDGKWEVEICDLLLILILPPRSILVPLLLLPLLVLGLDGLAHEGLPHHLHDRLRLRVQVQGRGAALLVGVGRRLFPDAPYLQTFGTNSNVKIKAYVGISEIISHLQMFVCEVFFL